ncbi:helix-turn-helix transcriptional regulator [Halarchaeum sp. P4]|uniref:helix-turn-helix transcriptional regulator n=1 Tax=Halarchaeum sp. P4 TaxID=3421639 RepID=UPI003EBA96E9
MTTESDAPYHCNACDRDFVTVENLVDHPGCGDPTPDDDGGSGGAAPTLAADGGPNVRARHDWHDLNGFQRDALTAAAAVERDGETPYGLAIKRELEDAYGKEVNHGRLYPNLDSLVNKGLIEKGKIDDRTNEYRVTERGFALLDVGHDELAHVATDERSLHAVATDGGEPEKEADVVKLTHAQVADLANDGLAWVITDDRVLVLGREDRYPELLDDVADAADQDEVVLERIRDASGDDTEAK